MTARIYAHDVATEGRDRHLTEAYHTLSALGGRDHAVREVFTAGIAAAHRRDRAAVDDATTRLTRWSESHLRSAAVRDTASNLEAAATFARMARIVWCCFLYPPHAPGGFCGAPTKTGGTCGHTVGSPGLTCSQHQAKALTR